MKRLGLLRHAKSDWDDMSLRDVDRALNKRGRRGASLMGEHIARYGASWDLIIASPAQRVRQTLEAAGLTAPTRFETAAYLADSAGLLGLLFGADDSADSVLLVAHNPGLQDLALSLIGKASDDPLTHRIAEKYPTAAFAVLELDIDRWRDCAAGCARPVHFARPRDFDPELGPDRFG